MDMVGEIRTRGNNHDATASFPKRAAVLSAMTLCVQVKASMFGRSQSRRERNQTPVGWMAVPPRNLIRPRFGQTLYLPKRHPRRRCGFRALPLAVRRFYWADADSPQLAVLAKVLLSPDFECLSPQDAGELAAIAGEFAAGRGHEDTKGGLRGKSGGSSGFQQGDPSTTTTN